MNLRYPAPKAGAIATRRRPDILWVEITPFIVMHSLHYSTGSRQYFLNLSTSSWKFITKATFFREWLFSHHQMLLDISFTADLASHSGVLTPYVQLYINKINSWGTFLGHFLFREWHYAIFHNLIERAFPFWIDMKDLNLRPFFLKKNALPLELISLLRVVCSSGCSINFWLTKCNTPQLYFSPREILYITSRQRA